MRRVLENIKQKINLNKENESITRQIFCEMLFLTTDIECDLKLNVNVPDGLANIASSSQFIDSSDFNLELDTKNFIERTAAASLIWHQFGRCSF